jgi:ATP synthase protein I
MTTAPAAGTQRPRGAARLVLRTTVPVALSALALVLVGAVVSGSAAALGALVGGVLLLVVLTSSALVVDVVASAAGAPVFLVSLMTYALNVLLVLAALLAVRESGLTDSVLTALAWTVAHVAVTVRARIPLYDLPDRAVVPSERAGA